MKLRIGFVSNSSSCSFQIYGAFFEDEDDVINSLDSSVAEKITAMEAPPNFELFDKIETYLNNKGLSIERGQYSSMYIGDYEADDDETGRQFKERVEKELKELVNPEKAKDLEIHWHQESWYDGQEVR